MTALAQALRSKLSALYRQLNPSPTGTRRVPEMLLVLFPGVRAPTSHLFSTTPLSQGSGTMLPQLQLHRRWDFFISPLIMTPHHLCRCLGGTFGRRRRVGVCNGMSFVVTQYVRGGSNIVHIGVLILLKARACAGYSVDAVHNLRMLLVEEVQLQKLARCVERRLRRLRRQSVRLNKEQKDLMRSHHYGQPDHQIGQWQPYELLRSLDAQHPEITNTAVGMLHKEMQREILACKHAQQQASQVLVSIKTRRKAVKELHHLWLWVKRVEAICADSVRQSVQAISV